MSSRGRPDREICECGLGYIRGSPEDERMHTEVHGEFARGPTIRRLSELEKLRSVRDLELLRADANTPEYLRLEVAYIARVAQRETPDFKAGYDGTITDEEPSLYVLAEGSRAVGMCLVGRTQRSWRLRWVSESRACLRAKDASNADRPLVARVWIAGDYRRQGLGGALMCAVIDESGIPSAQWCWQLPFSYAGRRFARHLTAAEWYGDGDAFDLQGILADPPDCV